MGSGKSTWLNQTVCPDGKEIFGVTVGERYEYGSVPLRAMAQGRSVTQMPTILKHSEKPYAHAVYQLPNEQPVEDTACNLLDVVQLPKDAVTMFDRFIELQTNLQKYCDADRGAVVQLVLGGPWAPGPMFEFHDVRVVFNLSDELFIRR